MHPQPKAQVEHHVDHIQHLTTQAHDALNNKATGTTRPADLYLAAIQATARQARAALQPRPGRVRPYLLAA